MVSNLEKRKRVFSGLFQSFVKNYKEIYIDRKYVSGCLGLGDGRVENDG